MACEHEKVKVRIPLFDFSKALPFSFPVADQSVLDGAAVLGECRRVENNQIVGVGGHFTEESECVHVVGMVTGIVREIQGYVGVGQGDRLRRGVHRVHAQRSSTHGIDGESSRIAEHVEYFPAIGEALEKPAVFALVHEKSCFLSLHPVDVEEQSVLGGDVAVVAAGEIFVLRVEVGFVGRVVSLL